MSVDGTRLWQANPIAIQSLETKSEQDIHLRQIRSLCAIASRLRSNLLSMPVIVVINGSLLIQTIDHLISFAFTNLEREPQKHSVIRLYLLVHQQCLPSNGRLLLVFDRNLWLTVSDAISTSADYLVSICVSQLVPWKKLRRACVKQTLRTKLQQMDFNNIRMPLSHRDFVSTST